VSRTLLPGSRVTLQPSLIVPCPAPLPARPPARNIATQTSVCSGGRVRLPPPAAPRLRHARPSASARACARKPAAHEALMRQHVSACGRSARARRRQRGVESAEAASVHAVGGAALLRAAGRARLLRRIDRGHGRHEARDQRRKGQAARLPHLRARAAASALRSASTQGRGGDRAGRRMPLPCMQLARGARTLCGAMMQAWRPAGVSAGAAVGC
jgi:hypothetical protein